MNRYHIGLRTLKTALAVFFALLFTTLRGSPSPIFAGIGAIVAMSRTIQDAVRACLTQLAGITCGVLLGYAVLALLPGHALLASGLGIVLVILCCNALRIDFAIPLSCIVFVSVCLMPADSDYIFYGLNRFLDTSIGLVTALAVNMLIKPYNNREKISAMMSRIFVSFPGYLYERVLCSHYPDLAPLRDKLHTLGDELTIFENQPIIHLTNRDARRAAQREEAAYLRGCEQLLVKMADELTSLCTMDASPAPAPALCERLAALGLGLPEDMEARSRGFSDEDRAVQDFHLKNLLDAGDFFQELSEV